MKKFVLATALTLAGAGVASADPVAGVWKTQPGESGGYLHVTIAPCGEALCGTIAKAIDENGAAVADYEHAGKRMLWDMKADGGGAYSDGKIWAPDSDKTYRSSMNLSGDTLKVTGHVAVFKRSQNWKRLK
ncbi:hypothetical protein shim_19260 [Shimia sp. SK013]|uniref:DUF2147 domain-containing protein n=1 Tax=Shimia sp. SK013 TaxID=1389006 RepID=UPI0006B4274A|nr:DUF2147 domain-containing protein [Shimia sp. SK013]KPA22039.1 hypothetical protein shim_19260 [Shimia sp. SK013]